MLRCVTKSKAAFLLSCNRLFAAFPRSVYFWTFTFVEVMNDWQYPMRWNTFMRELQNKFGGTVCGLRVIELHPGVYSHGFHYHCLVSRRLCKAIVDRIAIRHGIGITWVEKADPVTASYLAKYLVKENNLGDGMRRWGAIGGFHPVKVNNIQVESVLTENIRWVQNEIEMKQFSYAFFIYVSRMTLLHGAVADWPTLKRITPYHATRVTVRDVDADKPDDDGIHYDDHHPLKSRFERLAPVRLCLAGEWSTVYVPVRLDEPF